MFPLRQSTASQEVILGPFLDFEDGDTPVTGLTIAASDIKVWKAGGTSVANKNSGGATEISGGLYYCVLDATDTNTIGPLVLNIHVAGALAVRVPCVVYDEAVYDVLFGTTAPATATNITAGTITSAGTVGTVTGNVNGSVASVTNAITLPTIPTNWITADGIAADAIGASELAAGAITEIQSGLATAASIAALNNLSAAQVNAEVDTALADIRLDELLFADSDIDGAAPPAVGSVFHELLSKTAGSFTFDQTTDSLEALRDRGDAAWTTATGFSTHSASDVWAVGSRTLTAGTNIQLPANGLANVTTWTVAITGNITGNLSGSVGSVTAAITLPTIPTAWITADGIATDAIGADEVAAGAVTKIQTGLATTAALTTVDTVVDAILALLDDARAEPGQGDPPVNPDAMTKLDYIYKYLRNKKDQTATLFRLYADNGTTVDQKAVISDDGTTTTIGEQTTGA